MSQIKHVLVATDFGATSGRAVAEAAALAAQLGVELVVLHVLEPAPYPYVVPTIQTLRESAQGELAATIDAVRGRVSGIRGTLREGVPWREIVMAAAELDGCLLVVGSHGRQGLWRALLGSVAETVVRSSSAPVLVVQPWYFESREAAGRELAERLEAQRERGGRVVAISSGGVMVAAEVARSLRCSVELLLTGVFEREGVVLAGLCEDGTVVPAAGEASEIVLSEREAIAAARAGLGEEAARLRGDGWAGDGRGQSFLLVSDGLTTAAAAIAAAQALRRLDPRRITVATPAASRQAVQALERHVDEVISLNVLEARASVASAYRDFPEPSERLVRELLAPQHARSAPSTWVDRSRPPSATGRPGM